MTRIQGLFNIRKSNNIGLTSLDQKLKKKTIILSFHETLKCLVKFKPKQTLSK